MLDLDRNIVERAWILASAKRGAKERVGMHGWHPYYAGYSESFVASALASLECDGRTRLLDPWGGSGTTGVVAARSGTTCVSADVNPVMATFTAAKDASVLSNGTLLLTYLGRTPRRVNVSPDDPLLIDFDEVASGIVRAAVEGIPFPRFTRMAEASKSNGLPDLDKAGVFDTNYAFCLSAIFITCRRLSLITKRTNPTWISRTTDRATFDRVIWKRELSITAKSMLTDIADFYRNRLPCGNICALVGDARQSIISNGSIDAIITSPPYLTRIDYAMATAPEMRILGDTRLMPQVRSDTMGAPIISKVLPQVSELWGALCNELLQKVYHHSTKAAASYYWKTMVQYFDDMSRSLLEIERVLKRGGTGLLVVQSSYFKELLIPLGDIYVEAARCSGLMANIVAREEIRSHMTHVNTKSRKYLQDRIYHEDVVYFSKR